MTKRRKVNQESESSVLSEYSLHRLLSTSSIPIQDASCNYIACPCCSANKKLISTLSSRLQNLLQQFHKHTEFSLPNLLGIASFLLQDDVKKREEAIQTLTELDSHLWGGLGDVEVYQKVLMVLHLIDLEKGCKANDMKLRDKVRIAIPQSSIFYFNMAGLSVLICHLLPQFCCYFKLIRALNIPRPCHKCFSTVILNIG